MKKMTPPKPGYFETAAQRTLSKVNEIGAHISGVTIGPNSTYLENGNCSDLNESRDPIPAEPSVNGTNRLQDDDKENHLYVTEARHIIESMRQQDVIDNVNERVRKLRNLENELQSKMTENLKLSKEEMNMKNKLQSKILESSVNNERLSASQKVDEIIKRCKDDKLKNEERLANEAKINEERIKLMNALSQIGEQIHAIRDQISNTTTNCKNFAKLLSQCGSDLQQIHELDLNFSSILEKVNLGTVHERDVETGQIIQQCISVIADKLKNNADVINIAEEELYAQERQAAQIQEELSAAVPEVDENHAVETSNKCTTESEIDLEKYVCKELLEVYNELTDRCEKFSQRVEAFIQSAPSRTFLRTLRIAIKTPVNAVSSTDRNHMRDKFIKISHFLRGNFSLPDTPMPNLPRDSYFEFVVDYLCKHFISHAESRFTPTRPQEAFVLASLALAIWSEFVDFGPILIGNIMKKCPYAIPAYWPRYTDQSDEEYFVSLGYKYKKNEPEDDSSFNTRMTGIFMLYISIIVTPFRRGLPHPYGIENAWKWIAALLNLEPHPRFAVLTAELLHVFLEICGHKMSMCYGVQFRKIVQLLIDEYIAKIEKITPEDFQGPISRLKLYVVENDILRKGFREPEELRNVEEWL